ncbi:DUF2439 domain-containing protein [Cephalotus follicularis]|uniref:DUF2439 domain-containing protein n=1 Tax=Cephalotus follicularis TaxID=3775 RepID=A0A1Q3BL77_CEPFO|nr:DUF2439 domain-containing protein [Cephalotus follicularis]
MKSLKKPGVMLSDGKTNVGRNKAWRYNLSPSRKIIKEFKKNELHKYRAPPSSPDTAKTSSTEWQVLYTTQMTQKTKKYHDGYIRLRICGSSGRQVMLFDESRKLLDSRFLKKNEEIRSGESLVFDAHLVEIGDSEGAHNPAVDLSAQGNKCINLSKTDIIHGQQNCLGRNRSVRKEFVMNGVYTNRAQHSSPEKSNITEWQVMYSTQVTQKAKKYHDGHLRLAICGSMGRQVMLYDQSWEQLSSRFLKNNEVIRPGEVITFDGYLVDIGEPGVDHQSVADENFQGNNSNIVERSGIMHRPQICPKSDKSVLKEWHALYTGQITQKAKKYQSGILRLESCGSYRMQVTLLTEDKITLTSKFLDLSEDVKEGNTYTLPKYLVEVGEQCLNSEGILQSNICPGKDGDPSLDEITLSKTTPTNELSCGGKPQNNVCEGKYAYSHFSKDDEIKLGKTVFANKPVRDAHQILSILQKPMDKDSAAARNKSMMKPASSTTEFQVSDASHGSDDHEDESPTFDLGF